MPVIGALFAPDTTICPLPPLTLIDAQGSVWPKMKMDDKSADAAVINNFITLDFSYTAPNAETTKGPIL